MSMRQLGLDRARAALWAAFLLVAMDILAAGNYGKQFWNIYYDIFIIIIVDFI